MLGDTFSKYINEAAAVESETPADTLPKGKYVGKVINAQVRAVEGEKNGKSYAFAETSLQVQVVDGPMKGQTTWIRPNLAMPEPSDDEAADRRRTYWVQHFYDATGLGIKLDPSWQRSERPNPKKPGKMLTVFKGKVLRREHLLAIAKDDTEKKAFAELLVGLVGIWTLDESQVTRNDGSETTVQKFSGVEAVNDANLAKLRQTGGGGIPVAGGPTASIYSR